MYGTQTIDKAIDPINKFENDVKMYGTQTAIPYLRPTLQFENDVKMYGTQTWRESVGSMVCLRMM